MDVNRLKKFLLGMKSLKESLFDSKTQTAMESLFDTDLVSKEPEMTVKLAVDLVKDHIEKKFKIKIQDDRYYLSSLRSKHDKPGQYSTFHELYSDGELDMVHIILINVEQLDSGRLGGIAISICISKEDDGVYLSRIDIGEVIIRGNDTPVYGWQCVWDGDEYKTYSKLKSARFDSRNKDNLFKYIDKMIQAVLDYPLDKNSVNNISYTVRNTNEFYF